MEHPMSQPFDASRSLTALEQDSTIIAAIEMSQSKWLVAAIVPGIKRQPLKKIDADAELLFKLLHRWRKEAGQAGYPIKGTTKHFSLHPFLFGWKPIHEHWWRSGPRHHSRTTPRGTKSLEKLLQPDYPNLICSLFHTGVCFY
jgi:hypothetical protein